MKIFKKLMITLSVIIASSCTLDLREDPNAVQPTQVLPSLLLNSMQRNLAVFFNTASTNGMQATRMQNVGSANYETAFTPIGFNGLWSSAYANILQDANALIASSDEIGYARHAGMARIIQAYTILTLVDYFGSVPFSEAFQGSGNFNPALDDETELYNFAIAALDRAKLDLTTPTTTAKPAGYQNPVFPTINDQYYNNNYTKWVKLANTLKLKAYLNLRSVDAATATAKISALISDVSATGGLISAQNENFIFRYGLSAADPEARHPKFTNNYIAGGGDYMANWLMWHMYHAYDATSTNPTVGQGDPRMRFYFYRQTNANSTSSNELRCLTESLPSHYPASTGSAIIDNSIGGRPPLGAGAAHPTNDPSDPAWSRTFCNPSDKGYWGRDHVDPQGIPPDGLLRTAWGVYPAGGRFDANVNVGVAAGNGMRGAGFQPIMMRAFVEFMRAEAAITLNTESAAAAKTHFRNGINFSMVDVRDWAVNGTLATGGAAASPNEAATINAFYSAANYTTDQLAYVTAAEAGYDADAMNYIGREYWIASFGNGVEAYNLYRRTGKPSGMQPVLNPQPGVFPKSFWYPSTAANLNLSIDQKSDLNQKVFWDKNTVNLDF